MDLAGLAASIEDLLRRTLGAQIHLEIACDPDLGPARVDANQLELATLNLTINARDAMPGGGTLRITLQNCRTGRNSPPELSPRSYVKMTISDTGAGMEEATLARAFDPFFTTKEIGSGSGLGLPMVQGFAVQSGGAVQIHSKPGEGTAVELWLPKADELRREAGNNADPSLLALSRAPEICVDDANRPMRLASKSEGPRQGNDV